VRTTPARSPSAAARATAGEADRQVHDPEGVAEPRYGSLHQPGGEEGRHEQVDLRGREPDGCRRHEAGDLTHPRVGGEAPGKAEPVPLGAERRPLHQELPGAPDQRADRHRVDGCEAELRHEGHEREGAGDHADVEEGRGERGEEEAAAGVEQPHGGGGQRHER
jgi:hypothetical protein